MAHVSNIQREALEDISIKSGSKNMDEDGLVTLFKDIFGNTQNKFPNDFHAWTVKKQCNWINQNIVTFFPNVPQSLESFIPATFCQLNYSRSMKELPEWMDMDKYRRGQQFVQKHFFSLLISTAMGLIYILSFNEGLKPGLLGGHIHTPYLGFKKYMSTLKRIISWYNGDPWIKGTKAYKDMQVTRGMHLAIRRKVCQMDNKQIDSACTFANPWCPDRELFLKDFAAICPSEKFGQRPYIVINKSPYKPKGVNNADVASVQSAFIVLSLLCPQNIGIHDATDEDLEAFCYIWKCYGYFLGLEDEYNFCRGSLEEIKQRTRDFYQYWTIENFKELTPEWEHATRCFIVPLKYYPLLYMPYKVMMLLATDGLNLNMLHLYSSLSYAERIAYKFYKFLLSALKFSSVRAIANKVILKIIDKAANFDAEKLAEIHEKSKKILPDFSLT